MELQFKSWIVCKCNSKLVATAFWRECNASRELCLRLVQAQSSEARANKCRKRQLEAALLERRKKARRNNSFRLSLHCFVHCFDSRASDKQQAPKQRNKLRATLKTNVKRNDKSVRTSVGGNRDCRSLRRAHATLSEIESRFSRALIESLVELCAQNYRRMIDWAKRKLNCESPSS